MIRLIIILAVITGSISGCAKKSTLQQLETPAYETEAFKDYWYSGMAEINVYNLEQARYGEVRDGKAVLIFVSEDFSKSKQVKLDNPEATGNDKVNVLKLNFTKNFVTGIYPYSMMLSAFTPVQYIQHPATPKITMSAQEWCGHYFTQLNLKGNQYKLNSFSYFETDGDVDTSVDKYLLEDEVWNLIRIDPRLLPEGTFTMYPGLFYTRLHHEPVAPRSVTGTKIVMDSTSVYTLTYPDRSLAITYENVIPYKIISWEENFKSKSGTMTTRGVLDKRMNIDYWRKNKKEFIYLRDSLGLSPTNY
jgi:hypothetical protein